MKASYPVSAGYGAYRVLSSATAVFAASLMHDESRRAGIGLLATTGAASGELGSGSRTGWRTVDLEVEPGSPIRAGFHLELAAHGFDKLATDGESQAGAGKVMAPVRRRRLHRLVQRAQQEGVDPGARVPNGGIEPPGGNRSRRQFHEARVGGLHRIRGEVQEHARQRPGVPHAPFGHGVDEAQPQTL